LVLVDLGGTAAAPMPRLPLAASLAFCRRTRRGSSGGRSGGVVLELSNWICVSKLSIDSVCDSSDSIFALVFGIYADNLFLLKPLQEKGFRRKLVFTLAFALV
jgi:hypothetical protein